MKRDLRRLADLGRGDIEWILKASAALKKDRSSPDAPKPLLGRSLGMIFSKPSTRTRVSFEVGMVQLGGHAVALFADQIQMSRGETVADSARIFSRYVDGLAIRTYRQEDVDELSRVAQIPVINMLTDMHHPCQALADLFTIQEKLGGLSGVNMAYVGDGNNVANSLIEAAGIMGFNLSVGVPPGYEPDKTILAAARDSAKSSGGAIHLFNDPAQAVRSAQVVYTDTWVSMGQDNEAAKRLSDFEGWQVNSKLMSMAARDAIVMHCLPAHRGEEISAEVLDGPQSVVWDQAENRLHTQKAALILLLNPASVALYP